MKDEIYEQLEHAVEDRFDLLNKDDNFGTKERSAVHEELCDLLDRLSARDKNDAEAWEKEERRKMESELEREKQKISWQRATLEIGKVVIPSVLTMIGYDIFQKRILKFEETGRISSTAGRDLHLPKFLK